MICAEAWTDHEGKVHERTPGTEATRCGLAIGAPNRPPAVRACRACVADHLREYAQRHVCIAGGCIRLEIPGAGADPRPEPAPGSPRHEVPTSLSLGPRR